MDEKKEMFYTRIVMALVLIVAYVLVFDPPQFLMWMGNGAWGICASVLIPILVLGSRWKRGNKYAAIAAGIVGMIGSFGLVVLTSLTGLALPVNAAVIGTLASTAVYVVLTLALPDQPNEMVKALHDKSSADED